MNLENGTVEQVLAHYNIPENLRGGLQRYLENHIDVGGFLRAVLENDLAGTHQRADHISKDAIPDLIRMMCSEFPAPSWGSKENVEAWLCRGQ